MWLSWIRSPDIRVKEQILEPTATAGLAMLYRGDALRVLPEIPALVDLTVTSPPYNLGKDYGAGSASDTLDLGAYLDWSYYWMREVWDATHEGGRFCLNVPVDTSIRDDGFTRVIPLAFLVQMQASRVGWQYQTTIDWCEGNVGRRTAWGSYARPSAPFVTNPNERILVLYKGDHWKRESKDKTWDIEPEQFKAWTLGSWAIPGESAKRIGHPAPFPEELARRLILLYSFKEDLICDPFAGSGTVNVVANRLGRQSVYIDLDVDEKYLDLATTRIERDGIVTDKTGVDWVPTPFPITIDPAIEGSDFTVVQSIGVAS